MDLLSCAVLSSFKRDIHLQEAVSKSQWNCVLELAREGVTSESLDLAFCAAIRQNELKWAREIAKLDAGPQTRNIFIADDVRNGRWQCAAELLSIGVGAEEEMFAIQSAIEHQSWEFVPEMVKHCQNVDVRHLVLIEAIKHCQWSCVLNIIKVAGLSIDEKKYICNEALQWGHWDCALELLRQGIDDSYTEWIVQEAFQWNQWPSVLNILKEPVLNHGLKVAMMKTAVRQGKRDALFEAVFISPITDNELAQVMDECVSQDALKFLFMLIVKLRKGRRVFKQLSVRQLWSKDQAFLLVNGLIVKRDIGLAFHVAVTQGNWDLVVMLFRDDSISNRARRFAYLRAVRQGAWEHVLYVTNVEGRRCCDRRFAFIEAVRHKECEWALKLFKKNVIQDADVKVAIKICISLGEWQFVVRFVKLYGDVDNLTVLLVHVVSQGVRANAWDCLREIFTIDFGKEFGYSFGYILPTELLAETTVLHSHESWDFSVPFLVKCFKQFEYDDDEYDDTVKYFIKACVGDMDPAVLSFLCDWCLQCSLTNIAVVITIVMKQWEILSKLTQELWDSLDSNVLGLGIKRAIKKEAWQAAGEFLKVAPTHVIESEMFDDLFDGSENLSSLFSILKQKGLTEWLVIIASRADEWDVVEDELGSCANQELVAYALKEASTQNNWCFVNKLLDKCADDVNTFTEILTRAVDWGEIEAAEKIISRVNPLSCTKQRKTLLSYAVSTFDNREEMIRLCIRAGVSTHQCDIETPENDDNALYPLILWCENVPIRKALYNGQLPLVKLLYTSGSSSNHELFQIKKNIELKSRLEGQGRHDMVKYLNTVATTPRTLQDLCRLKVSHLIGCHPGRVHRVHSLCVTKPNEELILFEDILGRLHS